MDTSVLIAQLEEFLREQDVIDPTDQEAQALAAFVALWTYMREWVSSIKAGLTGGMIHISSAEPDEVVKVYADGTVTRERKDNPLPESAHSMFHGPGADGRTSRQRFERCTALGMCVNGPDRQCGCYRAVDELQKMRLQRDSMSEDTFNRYRQCYQEDECTASTARDCTCPTARGNAVRRHADGR